MSAAVLISQHPAAAEVAAATAGVSHGDGVAPTAHWDGDTYEPAFLAGCTPNLTQATPG